MKFRVRPHFLKEVLTVIFKNLIVGIKCKVVYETFYGSSKLIQPMFS